MKDFQYLKNVATLRLNDKVCIGCGRCIECGACSKNCLVAAEHGQGALVP